MKKSVIAAGTIAAALFAMQPAAQAGNFGLSIGIGGFGGHSYHEPHYNDYDRALPRWKVLRRLEHRGYHGFHKLRRKGELYKVRAHRHGRVFKIWVDAYTGRIVKRRRIA